MINNRTKVALMLSAPYSGATLFAFLLNRHSLISCDGETFPPFRGNSMVCSCGKDQIECDYYRKVAGHMIGKKNNSWDLNLFAHVPIYSRGYYINQALSGFWLNSKISSFRDFCCASIPYLHKREANFLSAHELFFRNSLRLKNTLLYFDGTKSFRRAEILTAANRFSLKAVHLIRDGRAFCCSYVKNHKLPHSRIYIAAKIWLKNIRKLDIYESRFPSISILHVRYEDICGNPKETLSNVCSFLGLPFEDTMVTADTRVHHILGNRMRTSFTGKIKQDFLWKSALSEKEISKLNKILGKALSRFNYK